MSRLKTIIYVVVALALAGAAYTFVHQRRQATEALVTKRLNEEPVQAPSVTVSKVTTQDFVETVEVSGSLVAREEILVSPEVDGLRVLDVLVDEGTVVKRGQVLARLDAVQLAAQLAQKDAALAANHASIAQAKSAIVEAEARAKEAVAQLERAKPLQKSGYLSGSVFDQRQSAARTTAAQLTAARDGLNAALAQQTNLEAQKREFAWRLGKVDVTAPEDGVISRRTARIGATASTAGEPMFRIIENGQIELDAEIVETELARVKIDQTARITVPGAGEFTGKVRLVSPEIDAATRLGKVRILLGAHPALRIGAFARGRIETSKSRGLSAPNTAVSFVGDGAVVLVVGDDHTVSERRVETGLISGDRVEITNGLSANELIVTRSGTFLRDGDTVIPILPDAKLSEAGP